MTGAVLLGLAVFCSTMGVGAFGPLLPEVARVSGLADWQLGVVAGSFGFARMIAAMPAGALASRRLASALTAAPLVLVVGMVLLASAGSFAALVLGRFCMGLAHTLGMVGALTAVLQDEDRASASLRLNTLEFSGMLGILGGLVVLGVAPAFWDWRVSFLVAGSPVVVGLLLVPVLRRRFADAGPAAAPAAPRERAGPGMPLRATPRVVWMMFGLGIVSALAWSSVSQFLLPVRGTRVFGLDRAGISRLLAISQVVDLLVLLPVGRLADRVGRGPVLVVVAAFLGLGTLAVGAGSYPWVVAGCVGFGLGLAGWMLPLGVVREHTPPARLGWWTGFYRLCIDGAIFVGPVVSGALGERGAGVFVSGVGLIALTLAAGLALRRR